MMYDTVCYVICNVYGIMKLHRIKHGTLGPRNKRFDYLNRMCRRIRYVVSRIEECFVFRVSRVQTATRTCILEKIDPQRTKFTPSSDWGDEEIENNMIFVF